MNSKQALEAYRRLCRHLDYDNDDYMFNGGYEEDNEVIENALKDYEILKKDLEVLEILKKWIVVNESYDDLFPYEIDVKQQYVSNRSCLVLTEEDFNKIKEWLENE